MNIVIVDDQPADRRWLNEKIEGYMKSRGLPFQLFEYESAEDFLAAFSPGHFDIIFMDIYMNGMNGMEAAKLLRKQDMDCKLIFLTSSEDFLRQGYSVNACHYLIKPASDEKFLEAMEHCRIKPPYDTPFLDVSSGGLDLHLDTSKILYVMMENRTVIVHMLHQTIPVRGTFGKVTQPLLADSRFLLCIQGVLVNMDFIKAQTESVFIMKNGDRLQINLRKKKAIIQAYHSYIFTKMSAED